MNEPWLGSEIAQAGLDLRDFTLMLFDHGRPLQRHVEDARPKANFASDQEAARRKT